uniref:Uncharacterized protein n=1 Tax=Rousettus aegyptiacus TaxID=9407 RepID=A0A7J8E8I9_ROUAE|nr:hypothetical protein HJG63_008137 [Rousettus aegyptiacus]
MLPPDLCYSRYDLFFSSLFLLLSPSSPSFFQLCESIKIFGVFFPHFWLLHLLCLCLPILYLLFYSLDFLINIKSSEKLSKRAPCYFLSWHLIFFYHSFLEPLAVCLHHQIISSMKGKMLLVCLTIDSSASCVVLDK